MTAAVIPRLAGHAVLRRPLPIFSSPAIDQPLLVPPRRPMSSASAAAGEPHDKHNYLKCRMQIHKKKEELYDLMAEVERNKNCVGGGSNAGARAQNQELLEDLSLLVEPKLDDPDWQRYRKVKQLRDCEQGVFRFWAKMLLGFMAIGTIVTKIRLLDSDIN